jgi:hypothetical protein
VVLLRVVEADTGMDRAAGLLPIRSMPAPSTVVLSSAAINAEVVFFIKYLFYNYSLVALCGVPDPDFGAQATIIAGRSASGLRFRYRHHFRRASCGSSVNQL